jgi:hypothetical protein
LIKDGHENLQELIYFKDSLSIGDKWSQKIIGSGGMTLTYNFETISTAITTLANMPTVRLFK